MAELQALLDAYTGSDLGYWVATLTGFIWSILYFNLRKKVKDQELLRSDLMASYIEDANSSKTKEHTAYLHGCLTTLQSLDSIVLGNSLTEKAKRLWKGL